MYSTDSFLSLLPRTHFVGISAAYMHIYSVSIITTYIYAFYRLISRRNQCSNISTFLLNQQKPILDTHSHVHTCLFFRSYKVIHSPHCDCTNRQTGLSEYLHCKNVRVISTLPRLAQLHPFRSNPHTFHSLTTYHAGD